MVARGRSVGKREEWYSHGRAEEAASLDWRSKADRHLVLHPLPSHWSAARVFCWATSADLFTRVYSTTTGIADSWIYHAPDLIKLKSLGCVGLYLCINVQCMYYCVYIVCVFVYVICTRLGLCLQFWCPWCCVVQGSRFQFTSFVVGETSSGCEMHLCVCMLACVSEWVSVCVRECVHTCMCVCVCVCTHQRKIFSYRRKEDVQCNFISHNITLFSYSWSLSSNRPLPLTQQKQSPLAVAYLTWTQHRLAVEGNSLLPVEY